MDPFDALDFAQVPKYLTIDTLRSMRKRAALRYHPDKAPRGVTPEEAAARLERCKEVNVAFETLHARLLDPNDPLNGAMRLTACVTVPMIQVANKDEVGTPGAPHLGCDASDFRAPLVGLGKVNSHLRG